MQNSETTRMITGRVKIEDGLSENNAVVDLLNDLIATNRGIIELYQTAAEHLENESYVGLMQNSVAQHETFATELSNMVAGLSGRPETKPESSTLLKQAWVALKAVLTDGDGPILAAVAREAENVLEAYGEAREANVELPDDVREIIERHIRAARVTHEKLLPLSAALNS